MDKYSVILREKTARIIGRESAIKYAEATGAKRVRDEKGKIIWEKIEDVPFKGELSTKEHSINYYLKQNNIVPRLQRCRTKQEIYDIVKDACKNVSGEKTTAKRDKLLNDILRARSLDSAQAAVVNFYLKGDGLGVI